MADSKIDPFDIGALERAVNDSATRVSGLWLSFVAFSAYLAAAASNISHRQIFLEEPIKLPTINIDLPLVASAILLPMLFVIYHIFVLVQVVLLARTADAYNQALDHEVPESDGRTIIRQRLANTLFAQLFAGSPRERQGVLGWLLRLMAWITLAIAPVFVLIVFEIKFLPYHSALVTWTHRSLIALDLLTILLLWAGAVEPRRDISWEGLLKSWKVTAGALVIVAVCCVLFTFPGEANRFWMRYLTATADTANGVAQCRMPWVFEEIFPANFDRLSLPGEDFVDDDGLDKIRRSADAKDLKPYEFERTRKFRARDLGCGNFSSADLRYVDLTGARMSGARFDGAKLEGARIASAQLEGASLDGAIMPASDLLDADLQKASLNGAKLQSARLDKTRLQGASLRGAVLENASLEGAQLQRASLDGANLAGASLSGAMLAGASLAATQMPGVNLRDANLLGARIQGTRLQGADLSGARMQGADLYGVNLSGANLNRTYLQGATIRSATLRAANFSEAQLQGVRFQGPLQYVAIADSFLWLAQHQSCRDAFVIKPRLDAIVEMNYARTAELPSNASPEAIAKFIARTLELLPAEIEKNARDKLRADLQKQLNAADGDPRSGTMPEKWQKCADEAAKPAADEDQVKVAVDLGEMACEDGPANPYLARAIYANWIGIERLNESGRRALAANLIGSKDSPCAGASGLDDAAKKALAEIVAKKPDN